MIYNYNDFVNEKYLHYIDDKRAIRGVDTSKILNLVDDKETRDMFFKDPSEEDVIFLNKYLKDNKYNMIELYHGTSSDNNILEDGLLTTTNKTRRSNAVTTGFVYLSVYKDSAKKFAELGYSKGDISIYKVTIPVYFLQPDLDQIKSARIYKKEEIGDTLGDSALYGHAFRVKGDIPPYMITKL